MFYGLIRMLQFSQFVWPLSYSVWDVFNNFLLIDATDRSKILSDQKRFFISLSLYPFHFSGTLPLRENACLNLVSSYFWNFRSSHPLKTFVWSLSRVLASISSINKRQIKIKILDTKIKFPSTFSKIHKIWGKYKKQQWNSNKTPDPANYN